MARSPRVGAFVTSSPVVLLLVWLSAFVALCQCDEPIYITGAGVDGEAREINVARTPALYTRDFDDCLGGDSLFNITNFDAAYYADDLTVLFGLAGTTNIRSDNVIIHISVEAYGQNRFNMTYDPCKANIDSLCPLNASIPIDAFVVIPISADNGAGIQSIPLGIPDLEGFARIQLFANSTQSQIGCFQAVMTNGQSFSQPRSVGIILGGFALFAVLASFATAIYGVSLPHLRTHYAHSFSVLVVFETFQTIFFSGALSVNWPSVLPAWWSNFAWSAGMFADTGMVRSFSSFTGISGNVSQVGGAGSVVLNNDGGLRQQIYGRSLAVLSADDEGALAGRADSSPGDHHSYPWNGSPRIPGMPMPGTWPGFGGTLTPVNLPPAEAFTVALVWFLALLVAVALFVAAVKLILDLLVRTKIIKNDGFNYFRSHWLGYVGSALLRTLYIGFFTMTTLALYQLSLQGPAGPTAVAAVVFVVFFLGLGGAVFYACLFRLRQGQYQVNSDPVQFERGKLFKTIPFVAATRASQIEETEKDGKPRKYGSLPFIRVKFVAKEPDQATVHQDEGYIKRFGWLAARYRRSRWWYFAVYLGYQFVRACFIGGGSRMPLAQVFGLLVFEILALFVIIKMGPFEGNRNTAASTWLLSVTKIITYGLSIAFLPDFDLDRRNATIIGMIILVVQGFMTVTILVLVALGIISSWMSLSRNREQFLKGLDQVRIKYYEHVEERAKDLPKPKVPKLPEPEVPTTFNVRDVRRAPKIEDDDVLDEFPQLETGNDTAATTLPPINRPSRANSASSRYSTSSLPRAARVHRASWSSRDFAQWEADSSRPASRRVSHVRSNSLRMQGALAAQATGAPTIDSFIAEEPVHQPMTPTRESTEESKVLTSSPLGQAKVPDNPGEAEDTQPPLISLPDDPAVASQKETAQSEGQSGDHGAHESSVSPSQDQQARLSRSELPPSSEQHPPPQQ